MSGASNNESRLGASLAGQFNINTNPELLIAMAKSITPEVFAGYLDELTEKYTADISSLREQYETTETVGKIIKNNPALLDDTSTLAALRLVNVTCNMPNASMFINNHTIPMIGGDNGVDFDKCFRSLMEETWVEPDTLDPYLCQIDSETVRQYVLKAKESEYSSKRYKDCAQILAGFLEKNPVEDINGKTLMPIAIDVANIACDINLIAQIDSYYAELKELNNNTPDDAFLKRIADYQDNFDRESDNVPNAPAND